MTTLQVSDHDLSISDLWPIYLRRKRAFYLIWGSVVLLAAVFCMAVTRRYDAIGMIEVQKEAAGGFEVSNVFSGREIVPDALTTGLDLQTQAELLNSDTLALRVIRELDLEHTPDFERLGPIEWTMEHCPPLKWMLSGGATASDAKDAAIENAPVRRTRALKHFSNNLKVGVVPGTRLIAVRYRSIDPALSAKITNQLIRALVDFNFQARLATSTQASQWLGSQLGELRNHTSELQERVVRLQRDMGVFGLGTTDTSGKEQIYSTVLDQVQQATVALSAAQSNRILKGALNEVVEKGSPELISGLTGNGMNGMSPSLANSLTLVQNLRTQEATLRQDIAHDAAKFGDNYPPLNEKRASLSGLERSISDENNRIAARAKSDYEVAVNTEQNTQRMFEAARQKADRLNDKAIEFTLAKEEAEDGRTLYEDLQKRLQEAGLVQGLRSSNIVTADPGRTPAKPKIPNIPLYMPIAAACGVILAAMGAFLLDVIDTRIQTLEDFEYGRLPPLGILPYVLPNRRVYSLREFSSSKSVLQHSLRSLRTSLMFQKDLPSPKVILITSALPGEGKSTLAKGLAAVLAQQGRKVLLVEADLYRPRFKKDLNLEDRGGLSLILRDPTATLRDGIVTPLPELPNLQVMQAGKISRNLADLLESDRLPTIVNACRREYDVVLLDGPPVLPVADSVLLATLADTTIMVARVGSTPRATFRLAYERVTSQMDRPDVRVVLNAVRPGSYAFHNFYGNASVRLYSEENNASA